MIADVADGKEVAELLARQHGANSVASAIYRRQRRGGGEGAGRGDHGALRPDRRPREQCRAVRAAAETKCTEIDAAVWDRVMAINLRGPFLMVKHVAPHMSARGYGKIINIGSGSISHGIPSMLHYVTSKGGVMAMTRAMALELGEHGIRVNTLSPGLTMSETLMAENPEHIVNARKHVLASRYLKRDLHPQDLLGALVFLASAEATS